jgi:hypothetical protein
MKHRPMLGRAARAQGESHLAPINGAQGPDQTRYAGSTAFGERRLQFRENEKERIVEPACTGFAHNPRLTI